MTRTENDTWDLASSAQERPQPRSPRHGRWPHKIPDALLNDPWADPLVRAVGIDTFVKLIDGEIGIGR